MECSVSIQDYYKVLYLSYRTYYCLHIGKSTQYLNSFIIPYNPKVNDLMQALLIRMSFFEDACKLPENRVVLDRKHIHKAYGILSAELVKDVYER